jgi:UDP-4-amino-4,6-dideoxy-N-acetyl-beta-L-altrosamine transaminase
VNSATSALHLACLALEVGPGDIVWTSAISFAASANAARYCGAEVDFVDIELDTFNMSVHDLEQRLLKASVDGKLPKVVIPVHMAGQPCDMESIYRLGQKYGFAVIEDASHALGSTYKDKPTGSCEFSDVTVFSFHPVKMITTGEGGACTTNSAIIAARIQRLRSHGITRDMGEMENPPHGPWYYEQLELGFNYRITDIQCALGESQLNKLNDFVMIRNQIAQRYDEALNVSGLILPVVRQDRKSSFHLYVVRTEDESGIERKQLFERLRTNGIQVNVHYLPIYRHPYYSQTGKYSPVSFPNAEKYYWSCISLPIYPDLTSSDQQSVLEALSMDVGFQTIF